jgi:hypothetical protein
MERNKLEDGLTYIAEIDALKKLSRQLETYHYERWQANKDLKDRISLLGTDYGKPNATELGTKIAQGNRSMLYEMKKIVDERIKAVEEEFKAL